MLNAAQALQEYIDGKIPRDLQEQHARDVGMLRGGWDAALKWARANPEQLSNKSGVFDGLANFAES